AQQWAQIAVDRPEGAALPDYQPAFEEPSSEALVSFAFGIALGRFDRDGNGILDADAQRGIPNGILFLSVNESSEEPLGVWDEACHELRQAWNEHPVAVGALGGLNKYLRTQFFDYHKKLYENRPIYFPLSSAKKSFVAFVSIHRWADDTLNVLLADHLLPAKRRLDGELSDLRTARATGTDKGRAEKRFTEVQKLLEELNDFIAKVTQIAEQGPPPADEKTVAREVDARFALDLDDGVMVNSAALWPLLEPQWKDPKKWWKELANAQGKKDYDWAHLAARYFPTRARQKCHDDPSLAVAQHCFWELHPAKAYAWELRLQQEIRPEFTIDEPGSDQARTTFLAEHAAEARELLAKELKRREKKHSKAGDEDSAGESGPLLEDAAEPNEESADA
ncbi:MAG: SAM-dependent methyltransferase, partial [Polyangiaceae bacterium]